MIAIHPAHQSPLEGQVHQRKREDDMKGGIKMTLHCMLYVMHFIFSFVIYLLRIILRYRNLFSK
jgi:hypothetical protein